MFGWQDLGVTYMILRLFVLRIGKSNAQPIYRIAYGVMTPTVEAMEKPVEVPFAELGKYGAVRYYVGQLFIAVDRDRMLGVYTDLVSGISVKQAFDRWGIDSTGLTYDVAYAAPHATVPWCEESVLERLHTYSKAVCMLDPESLFDTVAGRPEDIETAMVNLQALLAEKTGLPFDKDFEHIGYLELLVTPEQDAKGNMLVVCRLEKGRPVLFSVQVRAPLRVNIDRVFVNVRIVVGGKTVTDTLQQQTPQAGRCVEFTFTSEYAVETVYVSVWVQRGEETLLVHRSVYHYIQHIEVEVNTVSAHIQARTEWLDRIRATVPASKKKEVDDAGRIERSATERFSIISPDVPEWIRRKTTLRPKLKTNDAFFPRGWDKMENEIGGLCFLEWFKRKTKECRHVFLQDPYLEDVGLFFLASANAEADYTLLTQTRLRTNTDHTTAVIPEQEESTRKRRIVEIITANPLLFTRMNVVIKDLSVKKNVLHDRYLIFAYEDGRVEGYALSNSIQGATSAQPLLVTQIGDNALDKVQKHIETVCAKNQVDVIYDGRIPTHVATEKITEIADAGFYDWMCAEYKKKDKDYVRRMLEDISQGNIVGKMATAGYGLACVSDKRCRKLLAEAEQLMRGNETWEARLEDFILDKHYREYPIGYIHCPHSVAYMRDFSFLLECSYEQIVKCAREHIIENAWHEGWALGAWGQYMACLLLTRLSMKKALEVLKGLRGTLIHIETDKTVTPVYKITNLLMAILFQTVLEEKDDTLMTMLLNDEEAWCRGMGGLILLYRAEKETFPLMDYQHLLKDEEERIAWCRAGWTTIQNKTNREVLYTWWIDAWLKLGDRQRGLEDGVERLQDGVPSDAKKEYVRRVLFSLLGRGFFDKDELCRAIAVRLFDESVPLCGTSRLQAITPFVLHVLDMNTAYVKDKVDDVISTFNRRSRNCILKNDDVRYRLGRSLAEVSEWILRLFEEYGDEPLPGKAAFQQQWYALKQLLEDIGWTELR